MSSFSCLQSCAKPPNLICACAFPDWTETQRADVIRKMTRNLGWMAAEFARLPKYSKQNIEDVVILDGHENFLQGHQQGKGVLYLTGHIGAWELSSFAHALYGYPLHYMARPLDNRRLDQLVNRYRSLSGNRPIFKNESARTMLKVLKDAGTVGILADQNTMPEEGVFVDFFGTPSLHDHRTGPRGPAHRRRSSPRLCILGRPHRKIPPQIRAPGRVNAHRKHGPRYPREHPEIYQGARRNYQKVSRSVGVVARPLEYQAARPTAVVQI